MKFTDWSGDANARMVHREIEAALRPVLARLMPEFNMVTLGINAPAFETPDKAKLVIHLERNGLRMPDEPAPRLLAIAGADEQRRRAAQGRGA